MNRLMMRVLVVILLSQFLLGAAAVAGTRGLVVRLPSENGVALSLYKGSYALVLGNSRYRKGMDPLPGVRRDVKDVAQALEKNGFEVTVQTDLTRSDFQRAVETFALRYGSDPDNRLLFYYAGHGHTETTTTGDAVGYLVMVDAPHPTQDRLGFRLASVDMQYFITQAKLIQAKHALFLFDSCFSGTILNFRATVRPEAISDAVRYPVRQFITAGRANEPVPDQSVFKQAFVDVLEGRAKEPIEDGYLTGEELGLYLKTTVPKYSPLQNPQYGKIRDMRLDKGDFVFEIGSVHQKKQNQLTEQQAQLDAMRAEIERLKLERAALEQERALIEEKKKLEQQRQALEREKARISRKPAQKKSFQQARLTPQSIPKPETLVDNDKPWQGVWEVDFIGGSYGLRTWHLVQEGNRVRAEKSGWITGLKARIKGNRLSGVLQFGNGNMGNITATMSKDGSSFNGSTAWGTYTYRLKARRIK